MFFDWLSVHRDDSLPTAKWLPCTAAGASSTTSRSTGSSATRGTSTSATRRDRSTPSPGTSHPTSPSTSKRLRRVHMSSASFRSRAHAYACTAKTTRRPILHRFANEDVSLGAWLLGLEVEHVDDRSLCCATPPGTMAS